MEIKYVVRTIPERKLDTSYNQINYELFVDNKHSAWDSFVDTLEKYSNYNLVLLEDDCILCRNFKERIEAIIHNYPETIINFYTSPMVYFTTQFSTHFSYNQCTYFPKKVIKQIALKMRADRLKFSKLGTYESYEVSLDNALKSLKVAHLQYRPCLVQHNDHNSTLSCSKENRVTPYFVDYLDDLKIKYFSPEILFKKLDLIRYRNQKLNIDPLNYK